MSRWSRDELLAALNLYFRTPFGKQHGRHPPIIALARLIDRTPNAVAMKLNNFTSLDPMEKERGIKGLTAASRLDHEIWEEFDGRMNDLAIESEAILEKFEGGQPDKVADAKPTGPSEVLEIVKTRRQQSFFRKVVLGSYETRCCITGNPIPALLRASHIVPWAEREKERCNPKNGLCLAATFDAAFDCGLISLDEKFRVIFSPSLKSFLPNPELERTFFRVEGTVISMPTKNLPDSALLAWHRDHVFRQ